MPPAADSLAKVIRPKSDVYSVMLALSFCFFTASFVLVWVWLTKSYDSGFPGIHGQKWSDENRRREERLYRHWTNVQGKEYLIDYRGDEDIDLQEWIREERYSSGTPKIDPAGPLKKVWQHEELTEFLKTHFDAVRTDDELKKLTAFPPKKEEEAGEEEKKEGEGEGETSDGDTGEGDTDTGDTE